MAQAEIQDLDRHDRLVRPIVPCKVCGGLEVEITDGSRARLHGTDWRLGGVTPIRVYHGGALVCSRCGAMGLWMNNETMDGLAWGWNERMGAPERDRWVRELINFAGSLESCTEEAELRLLVAELVETEGLITRNLGA